jgi:glycosyltransferase involved in cell wall biosynthesis
MRKKTELSIIIPFYNEEGNIPLVLTELRKITDIRDDIEIILINNGSVDNSKKIFFSELKKIDNKSFKVINISRNDGYGNGILIGLSNATGNLLSWTHADMQTDPLDVLKALELYRSSKEEKLIIKGKRRNRKLSERFFTFGMQIIVFLFLRSYLNDINAQPKLFSKKFYNEYIKNKAPKDFSLDLYLLHQAKLNKYKILEIPVYFKDRMHGEAKGGGSMKTSIKLIIRTLKYILERRKAIN